MHKWAVGLTLALSFVLTACGPSSYEECVVHYAKPGMSNFMINDVHRMCRKKFSAYHESKAKETTLLSIKPTEKNNRVSLNSKDQRLTTEEAGKVKKAFFKRNTDKQLVEQKDKSAENRAAGEKYLAENARKEGVTTTASGLQYKVIQAGYGAKPKVTDKVKVNYEGRLIDGTVFDSSYKHGKPIVFPLNGVIKGWTEGLQLMPVGSKYRLFLPSGLAYGARGAGSRIGPNYALIFDVELLGIEN